MNDTLLAVTTLATGLPTNWPERAAWLLVQAIAGGTAALLVIAATYWVSKRRVRRGSFVILRREAAGETARQEKDLRRVS